MFSQKSEQKSAQEQMLTNPDMMSGMMKQNLVGIVPQVSEVNAFTSQIAYLSCCKIYSPFTSMVIDTSSMVS